MVPAAGAATRFGAPKAVQTYRGIPMIVRVLDAARTYCSRCIVVTGCHEKAVRAAVDPMPGVVTVHNKNWSAGMISTIARGAAEVLAPWFFITPADMPAIPAKTYDTLMSVAEELDPNQPTSIAPIFNDRPGHPVLVSGAVRPTLAESWSRFTSMRDFLRQFPRHEVSVDDAGVVFDVDTPKDLHAGPPPT